MKSRACVAVVLAIVALAYAPGWTQDDTSAFQKRFEDGFIGLGEYVNRVPKLDIPSGKCLGCVIKADRISENTARLEIVSIDNPFLAVTIVVKESMPIFVDTFIGRLVPETRKGWTPVVVFPSPPEKEGIGNWGSSLSILDISLVGRFYARFAKNGALDKDFESECFGGFLSGI